MNYINRREREREREREKERERKREIAKKLQVLKNDNAEKNVLIN